MELCYIGLHNSNKPWRLGWAPSCKINHVYFQNLLIIINSDHGADMKALLKGQMQKPLSVTSSDRGGEGREHSEGGVVVGIILYVTLTPTYW